MLKSIITKGTEVLRVKHGKKQAYSITLSYDKEMRCLKLSNDKVIPAKKIAAVIYGVQTSNLLLASKKYDLVSWRCFSIVKEDLKTYDFVCENDDLTFQILAVLNLIVCKDRLKDQKVFVKTQIIQLYWKRLFIKFWMNKSKLK